MNKNAIMLAQEVEAQAKVEAFRKFGKFREKEFKKELDALMVGLPV